MTRYDKYLWYVLRHKWYVTLECWKMGLVWRGIMHDASKFLPSEFVPYARFFNGPKKLPAAKRDKTGYYKPWNTGDEAFDFAWLLHQKRNDHHWQWWVLPLDDGGFKVMKMSEGAMKEMVCDWKGAGKAQGTPDTMLWYRTNKGKLMLHEESRSFVEALIGYKETEDAETRAKEA